MTTHVSTHRCLASYDASFEYVFLNACLKVHLKNILLAVYVCLIDYRLCLLLYCEQCCHLVSVNEMSSCHRPRIYRSSDGCCICGAKSSSSRFTASTRYESFFERCFALSAGEQRRGDICNACVLLVKRFRKLPSGSTRCWAHVCILLSRCHC